MRRLDEVAAACERILDEVERAVVGKRESLELILLGILGDGHVLIEDYPGLAKTLAARSFAQVTEMDFSRIQFTPDLMPSDVTGSSIFDQRRADFEFRPGPIFTNLLLADEINRAPPKTQAALLEAMQERQVTIEGETRPLAPPFVVLATQNPIEYEGTYPLRRRSSTASCCGSASATRSARTSGSVLERRMERGGTRSSSSRSSTGRSSSSSSRARAGARLRAGRPLHGRPRRGDARLDARPGRVEPARHARAAQALARQGGARRAGTS